jgi:hypothetical protein
MSADALWPPGQGHRRKGHQADAENTGCPRGCTERPVLIALAAHGNGPISQRDGRATATLAVIPRRRRLPAPV